MNVVGENQEKRSKEKVKRAKRKMRLVVQYNKRENIKRKDKKKVGKHPFRPTNTRHIQVGVGRKNFRFHSHFFSHFPPSCFLSCPHSLGPPPLLATTHPPLDDTRRTSNVQPRTARIKARPSQVEMRRCPDNNRPPGPRFRLSHLTRNTRVHHRRSERSLTRWQWQRR